MIPKNELRPGNWVLGGDNKPRQIVNILSATHNFVWPIPLTPEILWKSGFTDESMFFLVNDYIRMWYDMENSAWAVAVWKCFDVYDYVLIKNTFKHVHQLQNLYYPLKGKELDIQL